jgi:uncharacterized repeat protein (TIGR03917 family)
VWRAEFERLPSGATYHTLLAAARRCRADSGLAEWAVGVLHDRIAREPALAAALVEVLLADGRIEQAWQVGLDHARRLPERQQVRLLTLRQATHPADVIDPYRTLIETYILDPTDKHRFRRAIALLPLLRSAHESLGDAAGFASYVERLRMEHKRRPGLPRPARRRRPVKKDLPKTAFRERLLNDGTPIPGACRQAAPAGANNTAPGPETHPCNTRSRVLMTIVASPHEPRHPAPRELRPIAGARNIGDGFYEIVVQPGAPAADVIVALDAIPLDATFVEVHDDIDTVLVFEHTPPTAPVPARSGAPDAPYRPALATAA